MKTVLVLLAEISGLLIIFALFLLLLGYFKIITLPSFLPQTITSTTQTSANPNSIKINPSNAQPTIEYNTLQTISMGSCPLTEGCKNAGQIGDLTSSASQNFSGLGFNPSGSASAILAAVDGTITMQNPTENNQALTVITITDTPGLQQFVYKFDKNSYFPTITSGKVKQDQSIGNFQNKAMLTYNSKPYSFIFSIYSLITKQYLKLQSSTDGLRIETPSK
jgi:hypothetical protein